jgi:cytidylate kinase
MSTEKLEKSLFQEFLKEQVKKWEKLRSDRRGKGEDHAPVITLSTEPGSGGSKIAQGIADGLGFDLYNREIIKEIAESVEIDPGVIDNLEKKRAFGIEDFVSSLLSDHYLWPGLYLEHLEKVVSAIGKHGGAVIVGRGANFILPSDFRLSLRIVAPLEQRVVNVAARQGVSEDEARKRIVNREKRRSEFIKKSFHADVNDLLHYDFVINTGHISLADAVMAICSFWRNKHFG